MALEAVPKEERTNEKNAHLVALFNGLTRLLVAMVPHSAQPYDLNLPTALLNITGDYYFILFFFASLVVHISAHLGTPSLH